GPSATIGCFFSSVSAPLIVCVATRSAFEPGGNGAGRFSDTTAICAQPAKNATHVAAAKTRIRIDVFECLEFIRFRGIDQSRRHSYTRCSHTCSHVPIRL